ncbi:MAG: sugar O-acyltransferase [Bacteroidales bacterium]
MNNLIIVGAGGFGREALYNVKRINKIEHKWNIKGFIDDNLNALDSIECDYDIIGTISDWVPHENEIFVMGVASPKIKEIIANKLKVKGAKFDTIIAPGVIISEHDIIGEGSVIGGQSIIGDCVRIGKFVHIANSTIGQDSIIDDYSTTTAYVNIASAKIGKRVFIGSSSVVLHNIKVGDDAFICVGSIVVSNVKPDTKVMGNPARRINI